MLKNEVTQLKQLLLTHKDCPVTARQKEAQGYLSEYPGMGGQVCGGAVQTHDLRGVRPHVYQTFICQNTFMDHKKTPSPQFLAYYL